MRHGRATFFALLGVTLLGLAGGCGNGGANQDACEQIVQTCHPVDPGSGPIHDCHEFAENTATTEEMCAARLDECRNTCTAAADAGHD